MTNRTESSESWKEQLQSEQGVGEIDHQDGGWSWSQA